MLLITSNAAEAIKRIIVEAGYDENAGLRVGLNRINEDRVSLALVAAQEPQKGDHVIDYEGVRLFIDPGAYATLDDRLLDAKFSDDGEFTFAMSRHEEGQKEADMWARGKAYMKASTIDPIKRAKGMRAILQERQQSMGIESAKQLIEWFEGAGAETPDPILAERMDMVEKLWSTSKTRGRNFTKSRQDSTFF